MFLTSFEQHFPEFAVPAVRFVTPKVLGTHSVVAMEFARPEGVVPHPCTVGGSNEQRL
jgi:hypothetical protein